MNAHDPLLARNWKKTKVLQCHNASERLALVCFLRERYAERFFEPIACLTGAPSSGQGYGFAIMSLCCLLIETIECYRLGWPSSSAKELRDLQNDPLNSKVPESHYKLSGSFQNEKFSSEVAFKKFFEEPKHKEYFPDVDGAVFYTAIRCGLLHQAQTKGSWLILTSGKQWDDAPSQKSINRNCFSQALKACFDAFLEELERAAWVEDPWKNAGKKIWWLAQTS